MAETIDGWKKVQVDEIDAIPLFHGLLWKPVRRTLGISAFGINAYESAAPGGLIVEEHDESSGGAGGHEEIYVVLRGQATFTIDGETTDAPAGTLVYIRDPALKRSAVSGTERTLVLAIGGEPGRAFEVSPWEAYFAALPDFKAERWDEAIATIEAGLRERPGNPALLYNLACAESLGGRQESALEHLRAAVDADPAYLETARTDTDLDAIRRLPGFPLPS